MLKIEITKGNGMLIIFNPTCSYPLINISKSTFSFLRNSDLFTTDFFRIKGAYLYPKAS